MKFGALSSDYEDYSLLGCDAMYAGLSLLWQRSLLLPYSGYASDP
jgi:hypothetical protein